MDIEREYRLQYCDCRQVKDKTECRVAIRSGNWRKAFVARSCLGLAEGSSASEQSKDGWGENLLGTASSSCRGSEEEDGKGLLRKGKDAMRIGPQRRVGRGVRLESAGKPYGVIQSLFLESYVHVNITCKTVELLIGSLMF